MALQNDQHTHSEDLAVIAEVFTAPPSRRREIRDDKPDLAARYNELWLDVDALDQVRTRLIDELRGLERELLTDADRARMADVARGYLGTGEFEDEDIPVTPCPSWCDYGPHAETRQGTWHEGASTDIDVAGRESMSCGVALGNDGEATNGLYLNVDASTSSATPEQAERFAAGLLRAANLYRQLAVQR